MTSSGETGDPAGSGQPEPAHAPAGKNHALCLRPVTSESALSLRATEATFSQLARRAGRPAAAFRAILAAMNASIVRLDAPLEPDVSAPAADRLLAGNPTHRAWNYFTDSTQTFFAGRWSATRGKWRVRYTENELCLITAGRVVITSDAGERATFGPGDAFVIPAGFSGTWEVLEDCSKVYAIFEPRS